MLSLIAICYLPKFIVPDETGRSPKSNGDMADGDKRLELLTDWVRQVPGLAGVIPEPASADASFRRYFRVGAGETFIVMDAPPPNEDCRPFVEVAAMLQKMRINATRVLKADLERGFLLLTDLGSRPYLGVLQDDTQYAQMLYADAIDTLVHMQITGGEFQRALPLYDNDFVRRELHIFREWLCERHLGLEFSPDEERDWQTTCDVLTDNALAQPRVFVHRDYHSRNLMQMDENNPGVIDFQDAVQGPYTYDLVSLLKDCYIKWPAEATTERAARFFSATHINSVDEEQFQEDFDLMGVQRHLKAAGIFARLMHRDGKAGYMPDVPRTLSYVVDVAPRYDALQFIGRLIADRVLPRLTESAA